MHPLNQWRGHQYPIKNYTLRGFEGKIMHVRFLHDASEIEITEPNGYWGKQSVSDKDINLSLSVRKPDVEIPVIEIYLNISDSLK